MREVKIIKCYPSSGAPLEPYTKSTDRIERLLSDGWEIESMTCGGTKGELVILFTRDVRTAIYD